MFELLKETKGNLVQSTNLDKLPSVDLILVDENIESLSLTDVVSALSKVGLASKTVVLTSAINPENVTQFLLECAKDVILKPYSGAEVNDLLN